MERASCFGVPVDKDYSIEEIINFDKNDAISEQRFYDKKIVKVIRKNNGQKKLIINNPFEITENKNKNEYLVNRHSKSIIGNRKIPKKKEENFILENKEEKNKYTAINFYIKNKRKIVINNNEALNKTNNSPFRKNISNEYVYNKKRGNTFKKIEVGKDNSKESLIKDIQNLSEKLYYQKRLNEELQRENIIQREIISEQCKKIIKLEKIIEKASINRKVIVKNNKSIFSNKLKDIKEIKNNVFERLKTEPDKINNFRKKKIGIPLGESIVSVNFISSDKSIVFPVFCLSCDIFVRIEEELYERYPGLRETENYFLVNGEKIKRFKTVKENGIISGQNIIIIKKEN